MPARYYAVQGFNLLQLYPKPGSGETLSIYYVPRPSAMAATADSPTDIPAEWHKTVEFYALWQGSDYRDDQSSAQGSRYHQDYMQYLKDMKKAMRWMGGKHLAPAMAGRRTRVLIPSDPSQDTGD